MFQISCQTYNKIGLSLTKVIRGSLTRPSRQDGSSGECVTDRLAGKWHETQMDVRLATDKPFRRIYCQERRLEETLLNDPTFSYILLNIKPLIGVSGSTDF